jgi:hypothetical protein
MAEKSNYCNGEDRGPPRTAWPPPWLAEGIPRPTLTPAGVGQNNPGEPPADAERNARPGTSGTAHPTKPTQSPAEAERLLADLREAVARARWDFGGPFPGDLQAVVGDGLLIAEGYVANHDAEAGRGWDALDLLRKVKPRLLATIARVRAAKAS